MRGAILLRKMNPRGRPGTAAKCNARRGLIGLGGETLGGVARLKERTPRPGGGETEERKNEKAQVDGGVGVGYGVGGAASSGAGGDKEGAAETGAKTFAGGAGTVERNRAEADYHRGGFAGGQVRLQAEPGFENVSRGAAACFRVHVLLYGQRAGEKAALSRRSQAGRFED